MIHFACDYMAGAHPEVLAAITCHNRVQTAGYGEDDFCRQLQTQKMANIISGLLEE